MKSQLVLLLPLLLLLPLSAAGGPAADTALERLLHSPALRGARVGVHVSALETGQLLLEHNADQLMVPASNQKLLTAAAVLAHWGPTQRFETPVYVEGPIDPGGVLDGTLWIEGRGDPSLVSESLWKLAEEIRLRGITQVRGGIAVDASYFDGQRFHPDWEPVSSRAYHAPTAAFAVNYSSFRVDVRAAARIGAPAIVRVAPFTAYLRVRSSVLTIARAGPLQLSVERLADGSGERVLLGGVFPLGGTPKTYWRAVALPERYAASLLRTQLESQGVRVFGPIRLGRLPESARELLRFVGEPLGPIVRKLDKFSNNFIAEQLIKALGADLYGPPGSWEKGIRALRAHLASIGIDGQRLRVADGSGLSPRNRISASVLAHVFRDAVLRFGSGPEFIASLPLGGLDGTLQDRMSPAPIPVRAKTGHLRHVSSLSGLLPRGDGHLVFSVLVNGARAGREDVDAAIDAFVAELVESTPQGKRGE